LQAIGLERRSALMRDGRVLVGVLFTAAMLFLLIFFVGQQATQTQRQIDALRARVEVAEQTVAAARAEAVRARQQAAREASRIDAQASTRRTTEDRIECLRRTLDTMIGVWPGRSAAPQICGAWPPWPSFGDMTDFGRTIPIKNRAAKKPRPEPR
jgi:hypothetical protein